MYESMQTMLSDASVDSSVKPKRIAYCTVEYLREDGATCVRFHHTDIMARRGDITTYDIGDWQTATTKHKLNEFGPIRWYQEKGEWYGKDSTGRELVYFNGLQYDHETNECINWRDMPDTAARARLAKQINKFARQVLDVEKWPQLPEPNNGDCWHCLMFDTVESGENCRGAAKGSNEHIIAHLEENYLTGSLIMNAMRWVGYRDEQIGLHYQMGLRDTICRAIRRYMRRRLGLAG